MASEHSFDISAEVDMMEVKNALETAKKEIAARYDFKGLAAEVELNEKEKIITLLSSSATSHQWRSQRQKESQQVAGI